MRYVQRSKQIILLITIAILLITLCFGFKPRGFRIFNQVQRLPKSTGLSIGYIGMLRSEKPLGDLGVSSAISIAVALRPYHTRRWLASILSVVGHDGKNILSVDQWKNGIEINLWDNQEKRVCKCAAANILATDAVTLVTITADSAGIALFKGDSCYARCAIPHAQARSFAQGELLLGLSPTGNKPWRGELHHLALYNHTLVKSDLAYSAHYNSQKNQVSQGNAPPPDALFLFDNTSGRTIANRAVKKWNLVIPRFPKFYRLQILQVSPDGNPYSRSTAIDVAVNLLGFIPLGFCLALLISVYRRFKRHPLLAATIACGSISLFIELGQVFIPTRTSQLWDLILNSAGGLIGASCALLLARQLHTKQNVKHIGTPPPK